jgi:hypothetical protein
MMKLSKSQMYGAFLVDFYAEVFRFAAKRSAWLRDMAFVEAERNFPPQPPERRDYDSNASFDRALQEYAKAKARLHVDYAEPIAKHPMISMCLNADGDPDFEIVDDSLELAAVFEPDRLLAIARQLQESAR